VAIDLPDLCVPDAAALAAWLDEHAGDPTGVWLVLAKGATTQPTSVTYEQAREEGLRHGWIDGQTRRRDEATYCVRFTPRRPRSAWSAINTAIVERLEAEGRMHPAGAAQVAAARADGRWAAAYPGSASMPVPDDLTAALDAEPTARAAFDALRASDRYAVLYRLHHATRPQTRAGLLAGFVERLGRGEPPVVRRG
jgi:uncharacterized protein YdeI (YjbR/CyaY-like superfamily)